ncbi:MAG: hypothetical protein GF411_09910 [Candidatus Lokiarchaeota archaeon]|nr:hypothetical protein [Candidatus Lokiarchaeota archaeon]
MDRPTSIEDIQQSLERAKDLIKQITDKVSSISETIHIMTQDRRISKSVSDGDYIIGIPRVMICLQDNSPEDRMVINFLKDVREKGVKLPSFMVQSSPTGNKKSYSEIVNRLLGHLRKYGNNLMFISLKIHKLPEILEIEKTIVIGKRFALRATSFIQKIRDSTFNIVEDKSEFGGGKLIFSVIESIKNYQDTMAIELTISSSLAHDIEKLAELFKLFTLVVS